MSGCVKSRTSLKDTHKECSSLCLWLDDSLSVVNNFPQYLKASRRCLNPNKGFSSAVGITRKDSDVDPYPQGLSNEREKRIKDQDVKVGGGNCENRKAVHEVLQNVLMALYKCQQARLRTGRTGR